MTAIPASTLTLTAPAPSVPAEAGSSILVNQSTFDFDDAFNFFDTPTPMYLALYERLIYRTPAAMTLVLNLARPGETADFHIGGALVYSATVPSDGSLGPISIEVPSLGKGTHYITATVDGVTISYSFKVTKDPRLPIVNPPPDADPMIVPGMQVGDVQRWVLQDLMPGGLGSWVMPANPRSMQPIPRTSAINSLRTVGVNGRFHINEAEPIPQPWSFSGYCPNEQFYSRLNLYGGINRRFYLIDHRNRAWTVTFDQVEIVPRKRQKLDDGTYNDWAGDYTVRAVIYDQNAKTPA